ncbi:Bleomycin hydrolase [Daphnia magna]|uniref:Bleomycin hydrolase n=1 Tax=Daphnia magna TaxID=35525 RepID=A0A0P5X8K8_9CRUS|nr:Bleomycin hydrolase [Daphnia magna]
MTLNLTSDVVERLNNSFHKDPKNLLAQNACTKYDPLEMCLSRKRLEEIHHVFTHKVDEVKPMTNQKSSGRCWIFAMLNAMRIPFVKHYNLEEFEFSQAYLFFWDKVERSNYFLNTVVDVAKRGEKVDGRLFAFLLQDPTSDGGQWDMLVNLVTRYGVMPKKCFPDSYSSESSLRMNSILKSKLREYAKLLQDMVGEGVSTEKIREKIEEFMQNIYRIVAICLAIPPKTFTWEYYDKAKQYCVVEKMEPKLFYENFVKSLYNVENKVCLVSDPRPSNPYGKGYTVDCLGNMVGGRKTFYINQPIEILAQLSSQSIEANEGVWLGCEVSKRFSAKHGIEDLQIHDYPSVFGVDVYTCLSKADRLIFGDSLMTHAMLITAVTLDKETKQPRKWRVENSWGDDRGEKGYLLITQEWFEQFVFEVVIDKRFVPEEILQICNVEPIILPAWDPMGNLANIFRNFEETV